MEPMQFLLRRTLGTAARILVCLLALGTAVPLAAHGDAEHDPCDAAADDKAPFSRLHVPGAPVQPEHCAVCHWLRSLRAFDAVVPAPSAPGEVAREAATLRPASLARLAAPSVPTRAPPA